MKEKDFQVSFNHWLAHNWHNGSSAFELKIVKPPNKSLPFSAIAEHQYKGLTLATQRLVWKISDSDMSRKPFDCFILQEAQAFVVVLWHIPRRQNLVTMIQVHDLIDYRATSNKKSVSQSEAELLATYTFEI